MSGELLDCPFCGSEPFVSEGGERFYIACSSLDCACALGEGYDACCMPEHSFADEAEAIAAWNTRTPTKAPDHG